MSRDEFEDLSFLDSSTFQWEEESHPEFAIAVQSEAKDKLVVQNPDPGPDQAVLQEELKTFLSWVAEIKIDLSEKSQELLVKNKIFAKNLHGFVFNMVKETEKKILDKDLLEELIANAQYVKSLESIFLLLPREKVDKQCLKILLKNAEHSPEIKIALSLLSDLDLFPKNSEIIFELLIKHRLILSKINPALSQIQQELSRYHGQYNHGFEFTIEHLNLLLSHSEQAETIAKILLLLIHYVEKDKIDQLLVLSIQSDIEQVLVAAQKLRDGFVLDTQSFFLICTPSKNPVAVANFILKLQPKIIAPVLFKSMDQERLTKNLKTLAQYPQFWQEIFQEAKAEDQVSQERFEKIVQKIKATSEARKVILSDPSASRK